MSGFNDIAASIPCFGIALTLGCYWLGQVIHYRTGKDVLQPILIAVIIIIVVLMGLKIDYETYNSQNQLINSLLPLTAVVLAVPLYESLSILKRYAIPILGGILAGTVTTMACILGIGKLMGTDLNVLLSMIPKSSTTPIAMSVSQIIGGIPAITISLVIVTGIFGACFGPELMRLFRIKHPVAQGITLGTIAHAVGTARAFREGKVEGSMSSVAMALAGILTALLSPVAATLFQYLQR